LSVVSQLSPIRKMRTGGVDRNISFSLYSPLLSLSLSLPLKFQVLEKSNFVDQIRVFCKSGHGGAGLKHFRRDKLTALGGPDGGDGGRGGHIILKGNRNLWTLLHLRYYKNVIAEDGEKGGDNNRTGRNGKDIILD